MSGSIQNEAYVFLISIAGGAAGGVVFDIFRGFRKQFRSKDASVAFQDILFWIISAVMVFAFMYTYNNGQPRWYIFIGIVLGLALYHASVSRFVVLITALGLKMLSNIFKILLKILLFILKIFIKPFKIFIIPLYKINKKFKFFFKRTKNNIKKTKKQLKMY